MPKHTAPLAIACFLAACAPDQPESGNSANEAMPGPAPVEPSPADMADGEAHARTFRYTSLEGCALLRENREEGGFFEHMCPGLGGYRLRLTESDLRQNLAVISPGGSETSLELGRIGGGAFSTLGSRVEWRGLAESEGFEPDGFVVRFQIAEEPYPAPETSYLLAVRLTPVPCVVGKIAPGPRQNERARAAADRAAACLK